MNEVAAGPTEVADAPTRDFHRRPRIVSYAQNFEDVILWRALESYGPGFYIDVGAGEPTADSVTQLFYLHGWRGINVEPMSEPFGRLREARVRDINLNVALESAPGRRTYFSVDEGNGLSTGSELLADKYLRDGRKVTPVEVTTMTLAEICQTFVTEEIHFLKIDVEGSEGLVIDGADFATYRPWILVIESPEFDVTGAPPPWHTTLLQANYDFIYFDGLNRFYVAAEKNALLCARIASPPNWIDNFVTASEVALEERASVELEARLSAEGAAQTLRHQLSEVEAEAAALRERIAAQSLLAAEAETARTALGAEVEACYQQLYESSRQLGVLSQERQTIVDKLGALHHEHSEVQARLEARTAEVVALRSHVEELLASESWRITAPVRRLSDVLRRRRR